MQNLTKVIKDKVNVTYNIYFIFNIILKRKQKITHRWNYFSEELLKHAKVREEVQELSDKSDDMTTEEIEEAHNQQLQCKIKE